MTPAHRPTNSWMEFLAAWMDHVAFCALAGLPDPVIADFAEKWRPQQTTPKENAE